MKNTIRIPMTQEKFSEVENRLKQEGYIPENGTIAAKGVKARYYWQGGITTLEITHKPVFVSMSFVEEKIREVLTRI